jgi:hypothetical protein
MLDHDIPERNAAKNGSTIVKPGLTQQLLTRTMSVMSSNPHVIDGVRIKQEPVEMFQYNLINNLLYKVQDGMGSIPAIPQARSVPSFHRCPKVK